ncbi:Intradiol ring-cleavage dioxygenase [Aspergillus foveolatus]|uniref:Intradiol ring-cleavage dioxygenase n=1 Tax=Aspergillus foveolatus TaxID=210207 RepID=UPI003CCD4D0E
MRFREAALLALAAPALGLAHGTFEHESLETQLLKRNFFHIGSRSLESCAGNLNSDGTNARARRRRAAVVNHHRRALAQKCCMVEHHVLLKPYGDTGPYYVPGELIRSDTREDQEGVPIIVEAQFIDFVICKPIPSMWWDMWNANATGVYSGVIIEGNGDFTDHSNVNNTFLRAVQQANQDGNGTITGGSIAHTGQFFFDQAPIDEVSKTYPYTENTYPVTGNALDDTFHQETAYSASDPVFHYEYLGDTLEDGHFVWVRIGVNASANWNDGNPEHSFVYGEQGGRCSYTNVGELPGKNGSGPEVYDFPPPTPKSWLEEQNDVAAATQAA